MTQSRILIRVATPNDFDSIWPIFHEVVKGQDTYPFLPETTKEEARQLWMLAPKAVYVAVINQEIVGTYYLKPNQMGLGAHIANGAYMVHPNHHREGIGMAMGVHSLVEAKRLGFLALQFNLIVSTNISSFALWQKLNFAVIGKVPKAFKHGKLGLVDAYIMYKALE